MRCTPRPDRCARFELSVREFTPIQEISEDRRPYSILGQRSITTLIPFASASAAAFSSRDAELHPHHARARLHPQRLLDDARHVLAGAEDVDHVDRLGDVGEARMNPLPQQVLHRQGRD